MESKRIAAEKAVAYVEDGMTVGLGTGSTAYWAIQKLGERVREGLQIKAVGSSVRTENLAKEVNIPIVAFSDVQGIDIYIDGADEVDQHHHLIKGGGGALLREKILAYNSKQFFVVVDESKLVDALGQFPLPVEIIPFAAELTVKHLASLQCNPTIRQDSEQPYITDNGNLIVDCQFDYIPNPELLNNQLHMIPGVVESGLFLNTMVYSVIVGYKDGAVEVL